MKMVLLTPPPTPAPATTGISSNGFYVTLIGSMHSLLALWKKKPSGRGTATKKSGDNSSLAKPKKFLAKISNIKTRNRKKAKNEEEKEVEDDEEFGDEGLWQREILMGEKCQPLDFSGVIYYDRYGMRLPEVPIKSPRASPLPSYLYASSKYADVK